MKKILLICFLIIIFLFNFTGCQNNGTVSLPVKINITLEQQQYNINDDIKLGIDYDFFDNKSKHAKIKIEADKPIKIKNDEYILNDLQSIKNKDFKFELAKPLENGFGEIRANLYTYDDGGNQLYYQSAVVFFLINDELLMLGENGVYALKIKYLDMQLKEGKIDNEQYKKLLEELSREGSITNSTIKHGGE